MSDSLLDRIRRGDREALQQHITTLEARLRRRVRSMLSRVDPAYDEDDVLASTRRRLDAALLRGMFKPSSGTEAAAYIRRVVERVSLDTNRAIRRRRQRERLVARHDMQSGSTSSATEMIRLVLREINQKEREMIDLWLRGWSHAAIARALGSTLPAYRSFWRRTRSRLAMCGLNGIDARGKMA